MLARLAIKNNKIYIYIYLYIIKKCDYNAFQFETNSNLKHNSPCV